MLQDSQVVGTIAKTTIEAADRATVDSSSNAEVPKPRRLIASVHKLCNIYKFRIDPCLKGSGPNGFVEISDIIAPLLEHNTKLVHAHVITENKMRIWKYDDCNELVTSGMKLKDHVEVRCYQERALKQVCQDGRAMSGNVKMPCGAGKTLWALLHLCKLQTYAIIFTNSTATSQHWYEQIHKFFDPPDEGVFVLDSSLTNEDDMHSKNPFSIKALIEKRPAIIICTYQMITAAVKHRETIEDYLRLLKILPFGLKILDEAQTSVADNFRQVLKIPSSSTLTISATFMREDQEIELLFDSVGPQLAEVKRKELVEGKFIPDVRRIEVHIESEPTPNQNFRDRQIGAILNPRKLSVCLSIVNHHINFRDKIIIFCDDLDALDIIFNIFENFQFESDVNLCGKITMHTPNAERLCLISKFRELAGGGILFMSKVGDIAVDLPGANILIQTSCTTKSKNQEIQRTGRIQRNSGRQLKHISYCLITGSEELNNVRIRRNCMVEEDYTTTIIKSKGSHDTRYDDSIHVDFIVDFMKLHIPTQSSKKSRIC